MPAIRSTAPGESRSQELRAGVKRPVGRHEMTLRLQLGALCAPDGDSICRTAVYVTCTHGGVGGGGREAFSYPDWASYPRDSHGA
jgi:hypothetical protein